MFNLWNLVKYDYLEIKLKNGSIVKGMPIVCNEGETDLGTEDTLVIENKEGIFLVTADEIATIENKDWKKNSKRLEI